ncbi:MAG: Gfo/Idh/MocA family oxidoreductase [Roseitalea sp.]|jgi:predicted dehydrogenase|nr:Gfo/Idh/MocA family oxidoreductase [Roseitalea sp.]MBO6721909.1 Gfo/Idh/MocA family oxidoreductase [Roseitalea sp.]MBO6743080.1 Gfo/Idh/MocA family oxidoreductase [Roseitalea sp.]
MLRWGILSTAKIAKEQVVPAIMQSETGIVAAVASRQSGTAAGFAHRFGIDHAFDSYEAMLDSDAIDAVYIPTVTSTHVKWAIKAAQAGKHVLVEKPLALNAEDIDPVIAARDAAGVTVSEAFMVTYHPQWRKVRDLIADGAIGTLRMIQGAFCYFNRDENNMRNIADLGGGALPDIGVYPTVATRFVTGQEPRDVMATIDFDAEFGTDMFANVTMRFDGFDLSFYVGTQLAQRQTMVFHGDTGFIEVQTPFNAGLYDSDRVTLHDTDHRAAQTFAFPGVNQYELQVDTFARHVAGSGESLFTLESSRANQRAIDAIHRAAESGKRTVV